MGLARGLTTLRTDKKPRKFTSAEEKRQYLEYEKWKQTLKASLKPAPKPKPLVLDYSFVRETQQIPSRVDTDAAVGTRKETRVYDGERKLLGIATMHKSSMVPVFDAEHAKDISRMRRG